MKLSLLFHNTQQLPLKYNVRSELENEPGVDQESTGRYQLRARKPVNYALLTQELGAEVYLFLTEIDDGSYVKWSQGEPPLTRSCLAGTQRKEKKPISFNEKVQAATYEEDDHRISPCPAEPIHEECILVTTWRAKLPIGPCISWKEWGQINKRWSSDQSTS